MDLALEDVKWKKKKKFKVILMYQQTYNTLSNTSSKRFDCGCCGPPHEIFSSNDFIYVMCEWIVDFGKIVWKMAHWVPSNWAYSTAEWTKWKVRLQCVRPIFCFGCHSTLLVLVFFLFCFSYALNLIVCWPTRGV